MKDETIESWLNELAARTPTPGGGAAAALAAATSAALIGMVANYTTGDKWADRQVRMQEFAQEAESLRSEALSLAEEDAEAFLKVGTAYKLTSETEENKAAKSEAIQAALTGAAKPPHKVAELTGKLVKICAELVETSNPNVISDVAVAATMAKAALESAIVNIEINLQMIKDEAVKASLITAIQEATAAMNDADSCVQQVRAKIGQT